MRIKLWLENQMRRVHFGDAGVHGKKILTQLKETVYGDAQGIAGHD
jgi:hypothetical protein